MILVVNQKRLSREYSILDKSFNIISTEYVSLLKTNLKSEEYLCDRLMNMEYRCGMLSLFLNNILEQIGNMVSLDSYQELKSQFQIISEDRRRFANLVDQYQQYSIQLFKTKRKCHDLEVNTRHSVPFAPLLPKKKNTQTHTFSQLFIYNIIYIFRVK